MERFSRVTNGDKFGHWIWVFALVLCCVFMHPTRGAASESEASDGEAVDNAAIEALGVFGKDTAVIYTHSLIAPQFHDGVFLHHVYYKFAFIVKSNRWQYIIEHQLRLREAILDELNRYSFARPKAWKRINTRLLKRRLLIRAHQLFGEDSVHEIYLMGAFPSPV